MTGNRRARAALGEKDVIGPQQRRERKHVTVRRRVADRLGEKARAAALLRRFTRSVSAHVPIDGWSDPVPPIRPRHSMTRNTASKMAAPIRTPARKYRAWNKTRKLSVLIVIVRADALRDVGCGEKSCRERVCNGLRVGFIA
jgi:hypothetical protein